MLITRGIPERCGAPSVLTIGNFDGVHLGHRALLGELRAHADRLGLPATVLTFEPHPREYFAPHDVPARLSCLREKLELLAGAQVDRAHVCRFNARFAALSAEEFIREVLLRGLGVRHLIIGDDFRFGRGRQGDFAMLEAAGRSHGFSVEAMHTVTLGAERVSSSAVRAALETGNLEHAARLLGRPYVIDGRVVHGDRLGRQLGYPTANVSLKRTRAPLGGVFVVTVEGGGLNAHPGVASLGVRPTVSEGRQLRLEIHLFDFDADIYGAHLRVNFLHKLRDEMKFDSLEALTAQIARDAEVARAFFQAPDEWA
ncbi:MAG: bifunctional riboflavin kinase/FAD synthetase [Betaproteobacteria bacterium]|nr:bifunctional riboflavin kinase/FAD synthetase [Betaproteobacteria bacterium]